MVAISFNNQTRQTKFQGSFHLDSIDYEYTIYLLPIKKRSEINEIVSYFGNRMFQGKSCLDVDEAAIIDYVKYNDVSAFIMVNPEGIDNIASGTLQIFDWCNNPPSQDSSSNLTHSAHSAHSGGSSSKSSKSQTMGEPDVWINDVCRVSSGKNIGNPLKGLFFLMEQLVVQNLQKTNIKLYIEPEPENVAALKPKYESLGFNKNFTDNPDICPNWQGTEIVMEKTGLIPQPSVIDFSFLEQAPTAKSYARRTTRRITAKGIKTHKKTYRKHRTNHRKRK